MIVRRLLSLCAMAALAITANALSFSSPGFALESSPRPGDASRTEMEAILDHDEASALISATGHPDRFENITEDRGPAVRHRASGLPCHFEPGSSDNRILLFSTDDDTDVGCSTSRGAASFTHYATVYDPMPTGEWLIDDAVAAIRQRFGAIRPFEGSTADSQVEGADLPVRYVARMVIDVNGVDHLTTVTVAQAGDWSIKQRMTTPMEGNLDAQMWSQLLMVLALLDVMEAQRGL